MKLGFIGCGNMASAMIGGILKKGDIKKEDIAGYDVSQEACSRTKNAFGIRIENGNTKVAEFADVLVLAVKPIYMGDVIDEIKNIIKKETIVVTLAPGKPLSQTTQAFGGEVKVIRTMPNTPAMVSEGMTALCKNSFVTDEELASVKGLFESLGKAEVVPESLMDAVCGVSGSSPAFVFMFIEAMADAAVAEGMPRRQAYKFAAQSVLGSAKLVLESGKHPGELKDMVCSPGGTTIEGVDVLEKEGFRSSVIGAVRAAAKKSKGAEK